MPIVVPLVALDVLVVALWCIAVALAIALVMDKLSGILAGVPWVGGKLSDAVKSMAKAVANAAGTLESGVDSIIGAAWHALARYTDKLFSQFVAHSAVLLHIARIVGHLVHSHAGLGWLVKVASRTAHAALKLAHVLEREYHGIEHRVKTLERDAAKGIGHDLRLHIEALERRVGHLTARVIPGIRADVRTAEAEVSNLYEWAKGKASLIGVGTFAFAVATALSALGLDWIKCRSAKNLYNARGCGMWDDLAGLLGLVTAVLAVEDFEQMVRTMQSLEGAVIDEAESLYGLK